MATFTYEIEFEQSPQAVFRYLDDTTLATQWLSSLEEIIPLTEGGNRVGAKSKHIYSENGRRFEMLEETLIYEPNERVKIHAQNEDFELTAEYRLEAVSQGTRLHYQSDIKVHNMIMKLLSPFINMTAKKQLVADFERLRTLLQSESLNTP